MRACRYPGEYAPALDLHRRAIRRLLKRSLCLIEHELGLGVLVEHVSGLETKGLLPFREQRTGCCTEHFAEILPFRLEPGIDKPLGLFLMPIAQVVFAEVLVCDLTT